ncbi:MAG: hypothetical protein N3G20_05375, partial [Verrucomicrobiae bacterium]|nr:hypothetical protein [Verrucomicrobiae bacterium]
MWRGKTVNLGVLRQQAQQVGASVEPFDEELANQIALSATRRRKKASATQKEEILQRPLSIGKLQRRAPFCRRILKKAFEEVMAGNDPRSKGGCLYLSEEMRSAQLKEEIDRQTNNHLVRHRLKILERLQQDIIQEYASGDPSRIRSITVEVNRDLREMSGKTAKEIKADLRSRVADRDRVVDKLHKAFEGQKYNGKPVHVGPSLIRKARVAADLGWTCPYTGKSYEPID